MKFPAAGIGAKVRFIFRTEERALVVIEPPGEALIARVFEVDDCILRTVKLDVEKKLTCAMRQSFVQKLGARADPLAVEMAEYGRGRQTIKAVIVVIDLHSHRLCPMSN